MEWRGSAMDFIDINKENNKTILLIHPISFTAEGVKDLVINNMPTDYRYIIPELAGHGRSNEVFKSAEIEAEKIEKYLLDNNINELDLAFGASLGGVVLLNILKNKRVKAKKYVFEGCSLSKISRITETILRKAAIKEHKKAISDRNYAVEKMAEKYGDEISELVADCFIKMDDESIKNIVHCGAFVNVPNLSKEEQEKCIFCYGSKEFILKDAKKVIRKEFPNAILKVWEGFNHCSKITKDSSEYCKFLESQL